MDEISRVGVIGGGSWGTALANLLACKGIEVHLWVREEEVFNQIRKNHVNELFLPAVELDPRLHAVNSFEDALAGKELVLMVVPSHVFRDVLLQVKEHLREGMSLLSATKGIENESLMMMSQVAESVLPPRYLKNFACLDGPSFAKEVGKRLPTAVTIACADNRHAEKLQRLFSTETFRVYISQDVIGVQLGGALKNVVAIAAGASDGLNFGHNARAALITRGLAEIARLGVAMGANPHTFAGLAGMGDLVLTCTGDLSRNRTLGFKIGKGFYLEEITRNMNMVAEGVKTTRSAYELARKMCVDMPITTQVYKVLYERKDPMEAVKELMGRELKAELEH
jgi:glycerol-3-phosphate dehydrogenase (NAD(P)+)